MRATATTLNTTATLQVAEDVSSSEQEAFSHVPSVKSLAASERGAFVRDALSSSDDSALESDSSASTVSDNTAESVELQAVVALTARATKAQAPSLKKEDVAGAQGAEEADAYPREPPAGVGPRSHLARRVP